MFGRNHTSALPFEEVSAEDCSKNPSSMDGRGAAIPLLPPLIHLFYGACIHTHKPRTTFHERERACALWMEQSKSHYNCVCTQRMWHFVNTFQAAIVLTVIITHILYCMYCICAAYVYEPTQAKPSVSVHSVPMPQLFITNDYCVAPFYRRLRWQFLSCSVLSCA